MCHPTCSTYTTLVDATNFIHAMVCYGMHLWCIYGEIGIIT